MMAANETKTDDDVKHPGKLRVLAWGDYCCNTGFGTVMSNIEATGEFEIDIVGINYDGDPYDHDFWKGTVYPAMRGSIQQGAYADVFGRQRVLDLLGTNDYDVLFMVQDTF